MTRLMRAGLVALMLAPALAPAWVWAGEGEGMPQLNFANSLTGSQVVWLAIIFAIFYVLLSRVALPQVAQVLEQRSATIAGDLDAARGAKEQADLAVQELTLATRKAHADAQAAIAAAVAEAKAEAARHAVQLNQTLEAQLAAAEQQITAARGTAMAALRDVATETASAMVQRLASVAAPRETVDLAVGAVLAGRG